jgi:hypothetical protein
MRLFFERMKEQRGEYPTTFQYEEMSDALRTQIWLVWERFSCHYDWSNTIVDFLRERIGKLNLIDKWTNSQKEELKLFFLHVASPEIALSAVELMCMPIQVTSEKELINDFNRYMREAGLGYQFNTDQKIIIRIEDETFYEEVTNSTLSILSQNKYSQAKKYYHEAYEELKKGKFDKAIVDCCKALESILKVRLIECGNAEEDIKAKPLANLLKAMKEHIILPTYMNDYQNNFCSLIQAVGTVRNKDGGHGSTDGQDPAVDERFVRYIINQTASNILFIAEADFVNK